MTETEIMDEITSLIRMTFGLDGMVGVTRETVSYDVDGWDSLSHATLMIMVERKFDVSISEDDSNLIRNVGDLVDLVAAKIAQKDRQ